MVNLWGEDSSRHHRIANLQFSQMSGGMVGNLRICVGISSLMNL